MNSLDIHMQLSNIKGFKGVFSINNFPKTFKSYPAYFVVNSKPDTDRGEHWFGICKIKHNETVLFCSYGQSPGFYNLKFKGKTWYYPRRVQKNDNSCAQHVIYFIRQMSKKKPLMYTKFYQ